MFFVVGAGFTHIVLAPACAICRYPLPVFCTGNEFIADANPLVRGAFIAFYNVTPVASGVGALRGAGGRDPCVVDACEIETLETCACAFGAIAAFAIHAEYFARGFLPGVVRADLGAVIVLA